MKLFDSSMTVMQRALDIRAAAQRVTSANIANVDTPGYTAQQVDFETTMQRVLNGQTAAEPIVNASQADPGLDGNNVDIDTELSVMGKNKVMYSLTAQLLAAKLRQVSTVIDKDQ